MRQPDDGEDGTEPGGEPGSRLAALGGLHLEEASPDEAGPVAGRSPRPARTRALLVSALLAVTLLACLGTAVHLFLRINEPSSARRPPPPPPPRPWPSVSGSGTAGPQPVAQPVRTENDLDLVCTDRFYPSAPRFRGAAPHPVMISEGEDATVDFRSTRTLNRAAFAGSAVQRRTWAPDPERAQIVACLDLTGPGRKIRDCRTGDATLPLVEGHYRLAVYEVATRRKIMQKALTGTDRTCPFVIRQGAGDTLHSAVKDQQLYDLLHRRVEG